jgi:beta-xylosidase
MKLKRIFMVGLLCFSVILALILLAPLAVHAASTAQNPILWADVPDPDVIRVGNNYYMVSTTMHFDPGVPIMKSTDLVNWTIVNYVYPTLGSGDKENLANGQNEYGKGSWASSLRYKNGTYYVSFISYTSNNTYVFQTTDIENGAWTKYTLGAVYHDSSLLFDDDGRVYLVYGGGDIKVVELNADAKSVKSGGLAKTLITNAGSIAGSGGLAAEGAHVYKINGKYYIFLIAWPSGSVRTELVYRADTFSGTYTGQVMLRNSGTGVAQGGVVDTPSGQWYAMLFQDHGSVGRIPYLIPVTWSNNWPVAGSTTDTGIAVTPINAANIVVSDEFSGSTLGKAWQWNHNPNNSLWSLTARSGYMRLTTGSLTTSAGILQAKNTLTQRTFGPESSANVAMDISNMKSGDYAGLSAFQFYYGFVGVKMSGTTKSIVMVRGSTNDPNAVSTPVEVASVPVTQNTVYFKVYTDYRNNTDKAYFYYSLNGNTWTAIGSTLQMVYSMPHFVGYRFGLFNYSTSTTGGYVDFDYMRVASGNTSGPTNTPVPPTNTPTAGPTATPGTGTIYINAGGSATGSFTADQYYSGGTAYTTTNTIDVSQVGSVPAAVFQSERYGAFSYSIPRVAGSAQTVTLYFAETYLTAAGQRLFNVSINGATVLSSFDIYAAAGGQNKAIAKTFGTTANSSGQVVIQLTTGTENPKINGIMVASGAVPTNTPVPPTAGPTATKTNTPVPPTAGPTITKTNTPVPPTAGPTPTRTNTPVPPTVTNTPIGPTATPVSGSTCSPVTATINAPFTQDGAGAFCWQSSNLGAYINSWNLASLTVNGVNATNLYVAAGSLPAKINGYWYVSYNSTVSWGHFEAK